MVGEDVIILDENGNIINKGFRILIFENILENGEIKWKTRVDVKKINKNELIGIIESLKQKIISGMPVSDYLEEHK